MSGGSGEAGPVRVIVAGAGGRMGTTMREVLQEASGFVAVAWVDPKGSSAGETSAASLDGVAVEADGVIEFTTAGAVEGIARECARRNWPLVTATTGITEGDREALAAAARSVPVLQAANLSLGVSLLRSCLKTLAAQLPAEAELEIVEVHHGGKQDAPSGTASAFFDLWKSLRPGAVEVRGRSGRTGSRPPEAVGLHSLRLGSVVGEHQLHIAWPGGERIELVHRVAGRESFARGALAALKRLIGRPPGLYGMDDLYEGRDSR